ncbi:MAG: putative lipid II flippase FtsW [Oscillospiraceae bacterium]|nr:putative lipid II flippase FtsW [Oscillospiraceae bacterium]
MPQKQAVKPQQKYTKSEKTVSKKKSVDFILLIAVLLLLSLGIVMVLSASSPTALSTYGDSYYFVKRQLAFAVLGIVLMFIISYIDYRKYQKFYKIIYIGVIVGLILVQLVGYSEGGAKRWIDLFGIVSIQPSELAKLGIIFFYATYLTKYKDEIKKFSFKNHGLLMAFLWLVPVIGILIAFQNHLSATLVICIVVAIMMLIAGVKFRIFASVGVILGSLGAAVMYFMAKVTSAGAFRIQRIISFLNPWADAQGSGWQAIQSLYAIGSGGLFGVGLGNSKQKYLYISEPHNDFIFAVLAEELGFIGCAIVIALFLIFIWRGIMIAMNAPDMFGTLVASGITALIGIQVIINIAVVTSSMPVTGMSLPFFSYGGSALVILLCAVRCAA